MKIKVEYRPDISKDMRLICEEYWLRTDNKRTVFTYTCKEIGKKYNCSAIDISNIANDNAYITILDCECKNCGMSKICRTRSELIQTKLKEWTCDNCLLLVRELRYDECLADIERVKQYIIEENEGLTTLLKRHQ